MNGVTPNRPYTRSTAEDERDSEKVLYGVAAIEPDPEKILPEGTYRVMHGELRKVVAGVSPTLESSKE